MTKLEKNVIKNLVISKSMLVCDSNTKELEKRLMDEINILEDLLTSSFNNKEYNFYSTPFEFNTLYFGCEERGFTTEIARINKITGKIKWAKGYEDLGVN